MKIVYVKKFLVEAEGGGGADGGSCDGGKRSASVGINLNQVC